MKRDFCDRRSYSFRRDAMQATRAAVEEGILRGSGDRHFQDHVSGDVLTKAQEQFWAFCFPAPAIAGADV